MLQRIADSSLVFGEATLRIYRALGLEIAGNLGIASLNDGLNPVLSCVGFLMIVLHRDIDCLPLVFLNSRFYSC